MPNTYKEKKALETPTRQEQKSEQDYPPETKASYATATTERRRPAPTA